MKTLMCPLLWHVLPPMKPNSMHDHQKETCPQGLLERETVPKGIGKEGSCEEKFN